MLKARNIVDLKIIKHVVYLVCALHAKKRSEPEPR